jgi:hypothetical protein
MIDKLKKFSFSGFFRNDRASHLLKSLCLTLILLVVSFPDLSPNFSTGVDGSLPWVFNYLFYTGFETGQHIIFPHGPLAFLLYPLPIGNNLIIGLLIYHLIKLLFCVQLFKLHQIDNKDSWLSPFLILLILSHILTIQLLITGTVGLALLLYFKTSKYYWPFIAIFLGAFSLYIKSYVGIVSILLVISSLAIIGVRDRKGKQALIQLTTLIFLVGFIWIIIYNNFSGFFNYFYGMGQLAFDNSSATALHPVNNWYYLSGAIILFCYLFLFNKDKNALLFIALFGASTFAAWKHGMGREDIDHIRGLFLYLVLFFSLFFIFISKRNFSTIVLSSFVLILFYANMKNAPLFDEYRIHVLRINGLTDFLFNYQEFSSYHQGITERNIESHRLSQQALGIIGERTVDVYPWDYAFIPANDLNWLPRPVLQSYVAYTPWLDLKNSGHFLSKNAPEYLIWEINKDASDINGGNMVSTDQRYLLDDEPKTILAILNNYTSVYQDEEIILLEKITNPILGKPLQTKSEDVEWNEWIDVPESEGGVLKAKIHSHKNLLGQLKSFLFKDEEYLIYYQLENGEILIYSWIPKNSPNGIWVDPFVKKWPSYEKEMDISRIQIVCSNKKLVKSKLWVDWEFVNVLQKEKFLFSNFLDVKIETNKDAVLNQSFSYNCDFDQEKRSPLWQIKDANKYSQDFLSSPFCELLSSKSYSTTFEISTDSLLSYSENESVDIYAGIWFKAHEENQARLVISVEQNGEAKIWESEFLKKHVIDPNEWNFAFMRENIINLNIPFDGDSKIKVYIWNNDENDILIDDFIVKIGIN